MSAPRRALLPLALGLLLALAGCSSFNRDWNALAETPRDPAGIAGRYRGTWKSDVNGHTGGLRCILSADETGQLLARYRATYGCCFSFEYTVPMTTTLDGDRQRFSAEADLGWLAGGRYQYQGEIDGERFWSTYACPRDHGTFDMRRVE